MERQHGMMRYVFKFGSAMSVYVAAIMVVVANRPIDGYRDSAKLLELLPILPLLFAFWAIIRQYKRCDEFFQRIHSEAFALGAIVWGLIIMCWGFAENAGLVPLPTIYAAPGLIAFWGLCLPFIIRRYQ